MKIAQGLAGFTLTEADVLRKAMGKKIKSLLLAQKKKFIEGCKKNEIPESISQKIWHWFEPFAHYSFNRSHAAAYATIAYQTAYLKVHYTLEFMASLLTSEKANIERIGFLMEECKRMGIEVLPPNLNESFRYFSVIPKENKIRFGLAAIKNVGENVVEEIVKERKEKGHFQSIEDFVSRVPIKVLNKKSLESLIKTGTFDKFGERKKLLNNLELLLEYSRESKKNKFNGQKGLFDGLNKNCHKTAFKLMDSEKASQIEKLRWEKELLGIYVSGHPLDNFKKNFWQMALPINQITHKLVGKTVKVCGVISGIKKIITKTGKPMLFFNLEDKFSKIEVVNFPSVIERNPEAFQENKIVLVSGRIDNKDDTPKLICETIEEIIEK